VNANRGNPVRIVILEPHYEESDIGVIRAAGEPRIVYDLSVPVAPGAPWQTQLTLPANLLRPNSAMPTGLILKVSMAPPPCPDCAVDVGQLHADGCDVARCWVCRCQRLMCRGDHEPTQDVWTGTWPEV